MMKTLMIKDLYCAAYLTAHGVALVSIVPGEWFAFVFRDEDGDANRALGDWSSGNGLIQARTYAHALKRLRYLMRTTPPSSGPEERVEQHHGNTTA